MKTQRRRYLLAFALLLGVEVFIALKVHDNFVRPYLGDVLVVAVLYCLVRGIRRGGGGLLPLWVFLFAALVEVCQYFELVKRLGLEDHRFLRTLLGSTFDLADIACYAVGGALLFLWQWIEKKRGWDQ